MKTSTLSPVGAGGGSRCSSRHTVKKKNAMLTTPNDSAIRSTSEKTGCSQLTVCVQRQVIQYRA